MKNTNNINMDGIEVNDEILKYLKNFKQGKLLESNYIELKSTISKEMLEHVNLDTDEIIKRKMSQELSFNLLEKYKSSFIETESPFGKEFSLSILAMSTQELKHIVDYCIRSMSESAIQEIRK